MKTNKLCFCVVLLLCSVFTTTLSGQNPYNLPELPGIRVQEGILNFRDSAAFRTAYDQLSVLVEAWNADPNVELNEEDCLDENRVLDAFESQYRYLSLRKKTLIDECEALDRGVDPLNLPDELVIDDVLASFLNSEGVVKVGADIYYASGVNVITQIVGGNMATLRALQRGESPTRYPGEVIVWGGRGDCSAIFQYTVNSNNSNTLSFQPENTYLVGIYYWTFGDGGTSTQTSPTHTYANAGSYEVCLNLELPEEGCADRYCMTVQVGGTGECQALFWFNGAGQQGMYCFTSLLNNNVVAWEWTFGDGGTSNQQNPCHTYTCDKTYMVSLTITTATGCKSSFSMLVVVNTNECCALSANVEGNFYYNNNQRRVRWSQGQINIPIFMTAVKAAMKHYRLKNNGNWATQNANLQLQFMGNVYTKGVANCNCQHAYPIGSTYMAFNKKKLVAVKNIPKMFRVKHQFNWSVRYTANNTFLGEKTTPATCN